MTLSIIITSARTLVLSMLIATLAFPLQLQAQAVSDPAIWHAFTMRLEPGKALKVRLKNGQRFKATLLSVADESMIVQPKTRAAVPPQHVQFADVETLDIDHGKGLGVVKAVAVGASVGAGVFLGLLMLAFATLGD